MVRFCLLFALFASACATGETLPPVTPPDLDPPPGDAPGVANDPVRQDYRLVLAQCEDLQANRSDDLSDAQRRRRNQTAVAAVAYAVGEATDVRDDTDVPLDGVGGQPQCQRDRDPNRAGPCVTPTPMAGTTAQDSPAQSQVDEVHSEASAELASIEVAIEEADEFLFSKPQPREWSDDDRAEWTARRNRLAQLCGYTAAGPTGAAPEAPEANDDDDHRFDEAAD